MNLLDPILERTDRGLRLLERIVTAVETLAARPEAANVPPTAVLWAIPKAAEFLKISPSKLYRLAEAGEVGQKVGGQWRFDEAEVRAYARGERRVGARVLPISR